MSDDDDGEDLFSHRFFFFKTCKIPGENIEAQECSVQTFKFISFSGGLGALFILQREQLPTIQVLFRTDFTQTEQPSPTTPCHPPPCAIDLFEFEPCFCSNR